MNYRANIVIFHEIAPLSAHTSKKEEANSGTGAREMAKKDRKTGGIRGCSSWHLLSRSVTQRKAPKVCRRSGSERSAQRAQPSHKEAKSPSSPCARSHDVVPTEKRRSKRLKPWAFFRLIGELSTHRPHRVRHPRRRKKQGRRNRRKILRAHARTTPSCCFLPSPVGSNSMVHNALRVKISHILTQRNHYTTRSGSTACGWTAVKQHEAAPASPRFTPVHPTLGRRMRA